MSNAIRRIGILTGGGDCPGLNAVIRAVVKSAIHRHGLEVWGIEDGFQGLIENRMRGLDWSAVSNILTLTPDAIQPTPEVASDIARSFVKGVVASEAQMISVLTIHNLLPEPAFDTAA